MSNIQITVEEINKMNPLDIALSAPVRQRFIQIYDTLWGEGTGEPATNVKASSSTVFLLTMRN